MSEYCLGRGLVNERGTKPTKFARLHSALRDFSRAGGAGVMHVRKARRVHRWPVLWMAVLISEAEIKLRHKTKKNNTAD